MLTQSLLHDLWISCCCDNFVSRGENRFRNVEAEAFRCARDKPYLLCHVTLREFLLLFVCKRVGIRTRLTSFETASLRLNGGLVEISGERDFLPFVHFSLECVKLLGNKLQSIRAKDGRHLFAICYFENACERSPRNLVIKLLSSFLISYSSVNAISDRHHDLLQGLTESTTNL